MKKIILSLFYIIQIINLFAQEDTTNVLSVFPTDSLDLPSKDKQVIIRDYAFLIDEDNTYSFTVDFICRIKNAYYIGAHTTVLDSTVYVKILEPLSYKPNKGDKIQVGNTYKMRLFRYYPYPLSHAIDYYVNYNFLFGKKIVSLQSTCCLTYIFSTNNLMGLYYINEGDSAFDEILSNPIQSIQKEFVCNIFLSIIKKNIFLTDQFVDGSAIIACKKKQAMKYSIVNHQILQCMPPFKLKTQRKIYTHDTKGFDLSEKLYYILMDACHQYYDFEESKLPSSLSIHKTDVVFDDESYITYRILWNSSLIHWDFCTYFSFKKIKSELKLIGINSCLH